MVIIYLDLRMAKVNVRVKYEGGQGVVRGLDPEDSLEKLISHSLESLGLPDANTDSLRMLTGNSIYFSA